MKISPLVNGSSSSLISGGRHFSFTLLIVVFYFIVGALTLRGQTWIQSPVFTFPASLAGAIPSSLVQASDGNFYGMASSTTGTTAPYGFIFQITQGGAFLNIHSFSGGASDGGGPIGALVIGHDGNLYGATSTGGANGRGTFFSITTGNAVHPPTFTPLFYFGAGSSDPAGVNQLIQGEDGAFYGTSSSGGSAAGGTLFKLSSSGAPPVWSLSTVYPTTAHPNVDTIVSPSSALLQDSSSYGFFWGASKNGPNYLFKALGATIYTVPGSLPGGGSNFVEDKDYIFYLAFSGAGNSAYPNGGVLKEDHAKVTIYSFTGGVGGGAPTGGLIMGSDGNLYGTTTTGGAYGFGTIFQMPLSLTTATTIYNFTASDGVASTNLVQGSDARFYGTAYNATSGLGEVYALSASPSVAQAISLSLDSTNISLGSSAHLSWSLPYAASGTSQQCYASVNSPTYAGGWSGRQIGTVSGATYSAGPITLTPTQPGVYTYALTCGGTMTGFATLNVGPVTVTPSSYDFGSVPIGSVAHYTLNINNGAVPLLFSPPMSPNNRTDISISDNSCTLPPFPSATCSVTFAFSPKVAGAAPIYQVGISAPAGSGIAVTPSTFTLNGTGAPSNIEKAIYTFPAGTASPSSLVQAGDGNLYGTAGSSSTGKYGVIYQISPSNDAYSVAYTFTGGSADGGQPSGPLVIGLDGYLYGITTVGGANGLGTFFRVVPTSPTSVETLYSFTSNNPTSINPLIVGGDGKFYATSQYGGTSGKGAFLRLSNTGGSWSLAVLYSFVDGSNSAAYPLGALVEDSQGFFWGTSPVGPNYLYKFFSGGGTLYSVPGSPVGVASNFVKDSNAYFDVAFSGNGNVAYPNGGVFQERSGRYGVFQFDGAGQGGKPVAGLIARTGTNATGTTTFLYGTTQQGGSNGYGTVFRMDASDGTISTLYNLGSSDGVSSTNLLQTSRTVRADGGAVQVYGALYAVTSTKILKVTPEPVSAGPVTLTANSTSLTLGSSLQLTWQTDGAFSQTAQLCVATVQTTSGTVVNEPSWAGVQAGTLTAGVYSGSATVTPSIAGTYLYGITCNGSTSSVVFVSVDHPAIVESIQGQYSVTNVDANTHSFGALPVGTPSSSWLVTLTNTSSSAVALSFAPSGDLADYTADTSACTSLGPQGTCSLSFVYKPSSSGQPTSFTLHVTINNSQVGVTFGGGTSGEMQTDGSLITMAGSGTLACIPGPKTVFAGGVDNLSTDAYLQNTKTLQSYGNTGLYVHAAGILRSRGEKQTDQVLTTFAATGPGVIELYATGIPGLQSPAPFPSSTYGYDPYVAGDVPSFWVPKIATLNLGDNACDTDLHKFIGTPGRALILEQDALLYKKHFEAQGGKYLLPFITPNCEGRPATPGDWATSSDWEYARDLVLKIGGIAIDDPANYFDTAQGDAYRKWVADVIRWCNQNGLVSMVVMSPYDTRTNTTQAFDADFLGTPTVGGVIGKGVEGEVTYLQSVDTLPTLWAVENYSFNDKIDNQIGADSDSTGLTINYVATWVAQHATNSPMPTGVASATSCTP